MQDLSKPLKDSAFNFLVGLGLPVPAYARYTLWGYEREGNYFYPIKKDLDILATALEMYESGEYAGEDVVNWFLAAPTHSEKSRRNFFYIRERRPLFKEYRLPIEQRMALLNGLTAPTYKEIVKDDKSEAGHGEGESEAGQGDGASEEAPRGQEE